MSRLLCQLSYRPGLAGRDGFEPPLPESKSGVLPLDERPSVFRYWRPERDSNPQIGGIEVRCLIQLGHRDVVGMGFSMGAAFGPMENATPGEARICPAVVAPCRSCRGLHTFAKGAHRAEGCAASPVRSVFVWAWGLPCANGSQYLEWAWSGRRDSNSPSSGLQPDALDHLATPTICLGNVGNGGG